MLDVCEEGTDEDRVWKDDLVEALRSSLGRQLPWTRVLSEIKRLGYTYERQWRVLARHNGQSEKGAIIGLRWKDEQEEE